MSRPKGCKNKPKNGIAIVPLVPETLVAPAVPATPPVTPPPVEDKLQVRRDELLAQPVPPRSDPAETPAPAIPVNTGIIQQTPVAPVVETPPAPVPTPPVETPPVEVAKEIVEAPKTEAPAETEDAETSKKRGRKPKEEPAEKKDQLPSGARGILIDSVRLAACIKACKGITTSELNAGLIQNLVSLAQASGTDELKARIQKSSEEYSE